jgi:hypothetical protein
MRIICLSLAAICWLSAASPGLTQQGGSGAVTAGQKDIGKAQTRIQKYEQALGVVNQLSRPHQATVECNAVCYFPSRSSPIAWRCEPGKKCDLHCTVNPPVVGCN